MDHWRGESLEKFGSRIHKIPFDIKQLKDLVRAGEGQKIEFKMKANHPEKIIKEMVAFANTDGGKLIIGVADDGELKGLKFAYEDEYQLINTLEKLCQPALEYTLYHTILPDQKEILIFDIPKSNEAPHYLVTQGVKQAFVRVNDMSVQASEEFKKYLKNININQNVLFTYGEKENKLLKYLEDNSRITVKDYSKIANIPIWLASKTLVLLSLANVLKIIPQENSTDYFVKKIA